MLHDAIDEGRATEQQARLRTAEQLVPTAGNQIRP